MFAIWGCLKCCTVICSLHEKCLVVSLDKTQYLFSAINVSLHIAPCIYLMVLFNFLVYLSHSRKNKPPLLFLSKNDPLSISIFSFQFCVIFFILFSICLSSCFQAIRAHRSCALQRSKRGISCAYSWSSCLSFLLPFFFHF